MAIFNSYVKFPEGIVQTQSRRAPHIPPVLAGDTDQFGPYYIRPPRRGRTSSGKLTMESIGW